MVTLRPVTLEELLTLPLAERVKWLHGEGGPRGKMSHDRLAAALGTTRQTVIGWERGAEPTRYADKLAEFSGFPREAWLRRGAEAVSLASIDLRLGSLEAQVKDLVGLVRESLLLLREAQRPAGGGARSRRSARSAAG